MEWIEHVSLLLTSNIEKTLVKKSQVLQSLKRQVKRNRGIEGVYFGTFLQKGKIGGEYVCKS